MRFWFVAAVLVVPAVVAAQPAPTVGAPRGPHPLQANGDAAIAIAANPPFRWVNGEGIAGSLYVGFAQRHAIRFNAASFARHEPLGVAFGDVLAAIGGGDGNEASFSGRTRDVGIGYQYFFYGKLWNGFSAELGLVRRVDDARTEDYFADPEIVESHETMYAARLLFGASLQYGHAFLATGIGASVGRADGIRKTGSDLDEQLMTEQITHLRTDVEIYMRLGLELGS